MLTLSEIAHAVDGVLSGEDVRFSSVSIDSRTLQPDALFVAIDGERF
ncbi:MAG: UDP-N-acetylmuramoyl-tripeptide--D-alanyl-D-alanine ligase, partial [Proteobacteria bacterium]|nr:UDP-N-acetylmuramoyl-tripeptide--D-alanyl-D-alanine ligase [Pseudomonadota bacterium]